MRAPEGIIDADVGCTSSKEGTTVMREKQIQAVTDFQACRKTRVHWIRMVIQNHEVLRTTQERSPPWTDASHNSLNRNRAWAVIGRRNIEVSTVFSDAGRHDSDDREPYVDPRPEHDVAINIPPQREARDHQRKHA